MSKVSPARNGQAFPPQTLSEINRFMDSAKRPNVRTTKPNAFISGVADSYYLAKQSSAYVKPSPAKAKKRTGTMGPSPVKNLNQIFNNVTARKFPAFEPSRGVK